jgi:hypothetical protein
LKISVKFLCCKQRQLFTLCWIQWTIGYNLVKCFLYGRYQCWV